MAGKKFRQPGRLQTLLSFAAGVLVAAVTLQIGDTQHVEAVPPRGVLSTVSDSEIAEQVAFCKHSGQSASQTKLNSAGFNYIRQDGIQPGLGAAGINMSMWVHDGTDIVSNLIRSSGIWEVHETTEVMSKLLFFEKSNGLRRSEVFFIDIGANVGWFTVNAAGMGYNAIAFEPSSSNAFAIRHTLCGFPLLQSHVALVNKGLSDKPERCSVIASKENVGDGHMECNPDSVVNPAPGLVVHGQFDLSTLDKYFEKSMDLLKGKVAVVKVDVEGFEDKVFKGANRFMTSVKPEYVLCEFHGTFSQGTTAEEMLLMFDKWGYVVHTDGFDGPVEPISGFRTLAERSGAAAGAINLYFVSSRNP